MYLKIGDTTLADDSDGSVSITAKRPKLTLATRTIDIIGSRYARNSKGRPHGIAFEFTVEVVRRFADYYSAEKFVLPHFANLASGAEGTLVCQNKLGWRCGYENTVLNGVEVLGEIGVSTTIAYKFTAGKPIDDKFID